MSTLVDTSAMLAVLNADDANHAAASRCWATLLESDEALVATNYVLVETYALVQSRMGLAATQVLSDDMAPVLNVVWVDEALHRAAIAALLTARRRDLSLVDCASFETMRRFAISRVFAFDTHFREQGFELVP